MCKVLYVTEFVKRGAIHASDFSTACVLPTALQFGSRAIILLHLNIG